MKIEKIVIENFRILKHLEVDLEKELTLVIGRNNSGKTSLCVVLEKFLSGVKADFVFEDLNIDTQTQLKKCVETPCDEKEYEEIKVSAKIYLSYTTSDDIGVASELLLDLDVNKNQFVVLYEFVLDYNQYIQLLRDCAEYQEKVDKNISTYLEKNSQIYFRIRVHALEYENESNKKEIKPEVMQKIITFKTISAKRDVANEQGKSNSLSQLANKYYKANITTGLERPLLYKELLDTDTQLTQQYSDLFKTVIDEIKTMSYNPKEAEISIMSSLTDQDIFQKNTIVKYTHDESKLPEDYNGLGYLNLFAIIFSITIKLDQMAKKNNRLEKPTPVNLLFIEEPEAHTHPQMQYIFITNVKEVLRKHCNEEGRCFNLQTIISTHSSHIVSQCDFEDARYFFRTSNTSVKSKMLKDLYSQIIEEKEDAQNSDKCYRFIKQYLTINRAELFFAEKAIIIEGDTERILLPAMMKKLDESNKETKDYTPLLSQNISVIEVGAYAHIFSQFLTFLDIKTLVITDLDCAKSTGGRAQKCEFSESETTTNAALRFFLKTKNPKEIVKLEENDIRFRFDGANWASGESGNLRIAFQKREKEYQARSFEDAFFAINLPLIFINKSNFTGLKCIDEITLENKDYYSMASHCIDCKPAFALDILLYSNEDLSNWETPLYIKEGLEWLAK